MGFLPRSPQFLFGLSFCLAAILPATAGLAAERVVLKYGILRSSVPVADLTTFAQTGKLTPALEGYHISDKDAQEIRNSLTQEIDISPVLLDRGLNNPLGDAVLDKVSESIQTPAGVANREALRSALVLAASDDGKISLLETIQKYPTAEVLVDVQKLSNTYNQVSRLEEQIRKVMGLFKLNP
jgi:hypothetical protein